jgi:hypothetical protein
MGCCIVGINPSFVQVNDAISLISFVQALDISRSFLNKILKKEPVELNENSVNKCKDSLDCFDKDLIRRVVVGFFSK